MPYLAGCVEIYFENYVWPLKENKCSSIVIFSAGFKFPRVVLPYQFPNEYAARVLLDESNIMDHHFEFISANTSSD